MSNQPVPENEGERLAALKSYDILDSDPEQVYDDITSLASFICETPIALVSLIDKDRQWFKSRVGLDAKETPRGISFCQHAIMGDKVFEVKDAKADALFENNPLVTGEPKISFYAGAPLKDPDGYNLGTLCVIDSNPKTLNAAQKKALESLARSVVSNLMLRKKLEEEKVARAELDKFFELSEDFLCIANDKGYFERVSPGSYQTLGYSEKDLLSRPFFDFIHEDDLELTKKEIEKISSGSSTIKFENRFRRIDGDIVWLSWSASPDMVTGKIYAIARNITDDKKSRSELFHSLARRLLMVPGLQSYQQTLRVSSRVLTRGLKNCSGTGPPTWSIKKHPGCCTTL